jgi:hypothetical protein
MNIRSTTLARVATLLGAGLLMSCGGGSYGGGGSNPPASLTISISPTTITLGQSATVTWTSNAPCTASGAWSGTKAASGSETVTPAQTGILTYTLICRGSGYRESSSESAALTVNPAALAGLWSGDACCMESNSFPVTGITSASGDYRFLALGMHYVGKAGAAPVAYATCGSCLAGERVADRHEFKLLAITPRELAHESISTLDRMAQRGIVEFSVPYDQAFERPWGIANLQGIYTTSQGTGYTLTIVVDAAGRLSGVDTNGCDLQGEISNRSRGFNYHDVVLDVSRCGKRSGRYDGMAAQISDPAGRATELFLSTSNAEAAIGWRLSH